MKLGAHIYLWTERWSDAEVGLLDRARGLGLDTLELSLGLDVKFSTALTRRAAEAAGVGLIVGPGGEWPAGADLSDDDPANRRSALEFHRSIINQAAELGAVAYAGALYGRPGKVLRRRPPPDELPRAADGLHTLAAHAQAAGVRLVIEPMSRFRSHVVNTPAQALQVLKLAAHPNLRILLDTYHLVTEVRDYAEAIRTVGDQLWGLHACENDRGVPGGGLLPWAEIFGALRATRAEYLGFEGYNTGFGDFGFRRGMFQNVCPDGDAFVREAVAFTRKQLQG
ncbi:MAG: sugar phosphate isomerase/epimerase [Opitutaceae bacterium]